MNKMTREEILAMEPGKEMNTLIARHVLGREVYLDREEWIKKGMPHIQYWSEHVRYPAYWSNSYMDSLTVGDFSFDLSAAWEVVEKIDKEATVKRYQGISSWRYWCRISGTGPKDFDEKIAHGVTVPEAICKAALLVVMDDLPGEGR